MTSHPVTQPIVQHFVTAETPADRAALILATPHGIIRDCRMLYRAALNQRPEPAISAYLAAIDALDAAARDQFGQPPRHLCEQADAARITLCVLAGSILLEPIDQMVARTRSGGGASSGPHPPG